MDTELVIHTALMYHDRQPRIIGMGVLPWLDD